MTNRTILFIYLFGSGNKAHKHHKHEQKKTDKNTDVQTDRHQISTERYMETVNTVTLMQT